MNAQQKRVMERWAKELRSGRRRQGRTQLRTRNGEECCLGVLCDMVNPDGWKGTNHLGFSGFPADEVRDAAGLSYIDAVELYHLNDSARATFEEIADVVDWIRLSDG